jgi:rare lipoprotein A (peptidoglycan hydrolase)
MPTIRQRMHPWIHLTVLVVIVVALAAAAPAGAARSVAAQRSTAARVMAQLDRLQAKRDAAAQREQSAHLRLTLAREAVANAKTEIAAATASLATAREALAEALVANYKGGGEDAVAYVLASGSFSDLVSRVDTLSRVATGDRDLIAQINAAQQRLRDRESELQVNAATAEAAARDATVARSQLDSAIARTRAVLAGVNADIRAQLAGERSRRSHLASKHSDGGSSGSGSGGGGSANVFYGECTWYGPGFAGHRTADGEIFDPTKLTAASPWLPFNTMLKVTNLATGLSVQVRVNDRGPFGRGVLDLSAHAAQIVGLSGWQRVRIQILPGAARPAIMP